MTSENLTATARILAMDSHLKVSQVDGRGFEMFTAFDYPGRDPKIGEISVGVGVEDGELLYALVRGMKPMRVLETGTNVGISSRYIALALADNGGGEFDTIEHDGTLAAIAKEKLSGIHGVKISVMRMSSKDFTPSGMYDFMFIDSNPRDRMPDMLRFIQYLRPGGLVWVHDQKHHETEGIVMIMGNVPHELKDIMKAGTLRGIVLNSRHGGCLFQKPFEQDWMANAIMKGN